MKYTQNYNFRKPEDIDPVDIQDLNYNADAIDGKLKEIEGTLAAKETPTGAQAKVDAHEQKAAPHSGHETPSGAQAKANAALAEAKLYAENVAISSANSALNNANNYTNQVAVEINQRIDETRVKVINVEKNISDISKALTNLNPNQEVKQSISGYGVLTLPKNAAQGQVSVTVKGRTWNNRAGAGDTSPQTIENLDSTKTYLLIKTDGGTVNVDGVDTAVPAKITGKTSTVLTWASGKIALYELSTEEAALTEAQLGARYHYVSGTKSTLSGAVVAKDTEENETGKFYYNGIYRSLPNGVKDEISLSERKLIKRVSNEHIITLNDFDSFSTPDTWNMGIWYIKALPNQNTSLTDNLGFGKFHINGMREILYSGRISATPTETEFVYYVYTSGNLVIGYPKTLTPEEARNIIIGTKLIYQLAQPIETNVPAQMLTGGPNHTVMWLPEVPDAGVYNNGISILRQDLPIKGLKKLFKIDFYTGEEIELDVTKAMIAVDKKSFTHPDLTNDDITFFVYEYPLELSTLPEMVVKYYDSRYVVQDTQNGKMYTWKIVSTNGVASIQLTEVV